MLFVYFLFYNSIINTVSSMFRCREEVIDGKQLLEVDVSIVCFTGPHITGMVAAGILALLMNVVFPIVLVYVLWKNRSRLHTSAIQSRYGFLYMGYSIQRGFYWWEAVVLLRKFTVLMVASSISDPFYQSLVGVCAMVAFLVLQVNFRPYDRALLNRLEMAVMVCLCMTQVVSLGYFRASALALSPDSQQRVDVGVTSFLFVINGACFIVLAVCMWWTTWRRRKEERRQLLERRGKPIPSSGHAEIKHTPRSTAHGMVVNFPWAWSSQKQPLTVPARTLHSRALAKPGLNPPASPSKAMWPGRSGKSTTEFNSLM